MGLLGGWTYDQVSAAGRARLEAEPAARSRVGEGSSTGRSRLVSEAGVYEELHSPKQVTSSKSQGSGHGLVERVEDLPTASARRAASGRVRLVAAEDADSDPEKAYELEDKPRRAIPAALELPANVRARVRPVQYNEDGYVPELPAASDLATDEAGPEATPDIRPEESTEPLPEEMPLTGDAEATTTSDAAPLENDMAITPESGESESGESEARETVANESEARSTAPDSGESPATEAPLEAPAETTPELSETVPEGEPASPAIPEAPAPENPVEESPSQYADPGDNALAQEGLSIQPQDPTATEPKTLSAAELCRKYQPRPIGLVGLSVKPSKPGAFPSGKDDPAKECFPRETEQVGQFGWYDNCPYGNYLFVCHGPLYFEEVDAERYGETWGAWLQPGVTAGKFFGTVPLVPYKWYANTFSEEQYGRDNFGQARNGYAEGRFVPPFHAGAAAFTGGLVTGLFFLIP